MKYVERFGDERESDTKRELIVVNGTCKERKLPQKITVMRCL
jgi:hypothetical protein